MRFREKAHKLAPSYVACGDSKEEKRRFGWLYEGQESSFPWEGTEWIKVQGAREWYKEEGQSSIEGEED